MKIHTSTALILISAAAWTALAAEFIADALSANAFATAIAIGCAAPACRIALMIASRVEAALAVQTQYIQTALDQQRLHVERTITEQVKYAVDKAANAERFLEIGMRSSKIAQIQVAELNEQPDHGAGGSTGTGPFSPFKNGSG